MTVVAIDPKRNRARRVGHNLVRSVNKHLYQQGSDLAGYAMVSWDARGECSSSYFSADGPVGRSLLPSFVKDALNRHLAVNLVEEGASDPGDGGA